MREDRVLLFIGQIELVNDHSRRIFLLAAHLGEGRFTEPTPATWAWRRELVFMPRPRRCSLPAAMPAYGAIWSRFWVANI